MWKLLFNVVLSILAIAIRQEKENYKMGRELFADDINIDL
jgi:hypothetical protein